MHHNWWGLQAQARYEDLHREAAAARLAATLERGAGLRQRLGRASMRLGAALAEAEALPRVAGRVNGN